MPYGIEAQELGVLIGALITNDLVNSRQVTFRHPQLNNVYDPTASVQNQTYLDIQVTAYRGNIPAKRKSEQAGTAPSADVYYLIRPNDLRDLSGTAAIPVTSDYIIDDAATFRVVSVKRDAREAYWRLDCVTVTREAPIP